MSTTDAPSTAPDEWKEDKNGKRYISRPDGRRGIIYQGHEAETPLEAFARDAQPKDERPRQSKAKNAKKPPKPAAKADLAELELLLAEAFRSPGVPCATFGDEWSAQHFQSAGPYLARNLVVASEHNPWLRRKLEAGASGGDMAVALMALVGVGGALVMYLAPPLIWWFNLPAPDKAREMFGIPQRREPEDARRPPAPVAAAA